MKFQLGDKVRKIRPVMDKVLVDRELLNSALKTIHGLAPGRFTVEEELRAAVTAQPAEAEGAAAGSKRIMEILAALAMRKALRPLHDLCEQQKQVSTARLEQMTDSIGDDLAGYALNLRIEFNKLSAALAAVTAERDRLRPIHAMILNALDRDAEEGKTARGEMAAELRAALAAKEA